MAVVCNFSVYSLNFETVFHKLSKHLDFRQKYSAARQRFIYFGVSGNVMKHCPSCLTCYINYSCFKLGEIIAFIPELKKKLEKGY